MSTRLVLIPKYHIYFCSPDGALCYLYKTCTKRPRCIVSVGWRKMRVMPHNLFLVLVLSPCSGEALIFSGLLVPRISNVISADFVWQSHDRVCQGGHGFRSENSAVRSTVIFCTSCTFTLAYSPLMWDWQVPLANLVVGGNVDRHQRTLKFCLHSQL